jgi:hypothetical protein
MYNVSTAHTKQKVNLNVFSRELSMAGGRWVECWQHISRISLVWQTTVDVTHVEKGRRYGGGLFAQKVADSLMARAIYSGLQCAEAAW